MIEIGIGGVTGETGTADVPEAGAETGAEAAAGAGTGGVSEAGAESMSAEAAEMSAAGNAAGELALGKVLQDATANHLAVIANRLSVVAARLHSFMHTGCGLCQAMWL
jgi:hypothetical protein